MTWTRAALIAALVFLALFILRLITTGPHGFGAAPPFHMPLQQAVDVFEIGRKNYASGKKLGGDGLGTAAATFPSANAESQKYEKIGSLTQLSEDYDRDRSQIDEQIKVVQGIVQLERATGLKGGRVLQLGIGVPPEKFDTFIAAARGVGKAVAIEIVKNDKTNDYLQLRAKRATLEKARTALEELRAGGGSTEERVNVQNRLTEIEQQIQDLGVSLGEFDSQNELCTVKLTLQERVKPKPWPLWRRAYRAFEYALTDYVMLGAGFFATMLALWIGVLAVREGRKLMAKAGAA